MKWFLINNVNSWNWWYEVKTKWHLPRYNCTVCGKRKCTTELSYPTIDISQIADRVRLNFELVSEEEYNNTETIVKKLSNGQFLYPGTRLGSLTGRGEPHEESDFHWHNFSDIVLPERVFDSLLWAGLDYSMLRPAEFELQGRRSLKHKFVELEAWPLAETPSEDAHPSWVNGCSHCPSIANVPPLRYRLLRETLPDRSYLCRLRQFPRAVFASEAFVDAVLRLDLRNISVKEVEISEFFRAIK